MFDAGKGANGHRPTQVRDHTKAKLMAQENESHIQPSRNLAYNRWPDTVQFKTLREISEQHLRKVYDKVDQQFTKQKLMQRWNVLMFCGIIVMEDEDEIIFEFHPSWKRIELKGKFYVKVVDQKGVFVLLKFWLPPSIEIARIWSEGKAINNNELVQIIQHINKEVRAFHSRSEQLKELEVGSKQMQLQIYYPESRKVVVLTITLDSLETDEKLVYSLILKYKSVGCLPFDVSLENDDIPKEYEKKLLQQASVFKKKFLWQAFCKYTFHSDSSPTSIENDHKSSMNLPDSKINISSMLSSEDNMPGNNSSLCY